MKKILIALVIFSFISCSNQTHKHDGKYAGEVEFFGMNVVHLVYEINGNDLTISNGITGSQKHQCKQSENSVEFQDEKGIIQVLNILENGDISINDKIILHKIKENKDENNNEASSDEAPMEMKEGKIDNFFSLASDTYEDGKPVNLNYVYRGNILNKSKKLFEDVTISMEVSLVLENGTILTENQYGSKMLGEGIMAINSINHFKPNESKYINGLLSVDIPIKYIDYPIKTVMVSYSFECKDHINNNTENFTIEENVTQKWKSAIKRMEKGKADYGDLKEVIKLIGHD